jgi:hypothetical protein
MTRIFRVTAVGLLVLTLISISVASIAAAGLTSDMTKGTLQHYVSIHYAKPDVPPGLADKDKEQPTADNTAYALLNMELTSTATYFVNPEGGPTGSGAEVQQAFAAWDEVTSLALFEYGGESTQRGWSLDGENTVSWAGIVPRDIVAVAHIWALGDDDGDDLLDIVEFDITFNALHKWGIDPDDEGPAKLKREFDVQNVATHEVGHVVGLADLYEDQYRELTMYGYASPGESSKISLEQGDVAGAQYLYGAP